MSSSVAMRTKYTVRCHAYRGGPVLWEDVSYNIVPTAGLNDLLTQYFKGSGYTASWFIGLIDNAGFTALAAGDTAAKITLTANPPTTNGWQEWDDYAEATREALTLGTAASGSIDNSASPCEFNIDANGTLYGAFVSSSNTIGGTSGVLYSEVQFSGGTQAVSSGNVVTVTVTLTAASA